MSLFGASPPGESPALSNSAMGRSRNSLFEEDGPMTRSTSDTLFDDGDALGSERHSPWDLPTPRKQQSRADLIRNLLAGVEVPESYIEAYDYTLRENGRGGKVSPAGVTTTLASAKLGADEQTRIMSILSPQGEEVQLDRDSFNVLVALIGLAQEGETINLDGVDERRRNLPSTQLSNISSKKPQQPQQPIFDASELAAKPPQAPELPKKDSPPRSQVRKPSMSDPEDDPWNTPDLHRDHHHAETPSAPNDNRDEPGVSSFGGNGYGPGDERDVQPRTTSTFTTPSIGSQTPIPSGRQSAASGVMPSNPGDWGYFDGSNPTAEAGFGGAPSNQAINPFGGASSADRTPSIIPPAVSHTRTISAGRTGSAVEENIVVTLMPEKEGLFMFQHHNYEVTSSRRGSKVIRRYSDFVWLLDCLHKRYPFRVLPLLPPKRVAVNGNHLSNDGAFIEKRRRGLSRALCMAQAGDYLGAGRVHWAASTPGLEDSLPIGPLNELFDRTRSGVRRSAELYINACNLMDRLVKRSEGVAADHARMAVSLGSLTEASTDTYATDTNDVPLLNDGLVAMSKGLRTAQSLLEDESRAWDAGVLEDLKRQRDSLVSVRDMFERRERLDKDNIPYLERRIQSNETKLAGLRAKPDGLVKPGEIERVVENIIKDKENIVNQHNRSVFVRECIRDELIYFQQTQYHVSRLAQDWAQERVKYGEMLADNWRRLLDELDGMPLGD
ncbi:hypothetical protein PG996_008548 [Apiospora saccharicola]|uniref:Sorting nexin MVP1 n=1 Tax=Apiospora saccharicola TaxID=335842 RepID=A0ABR1UY81_9PEZI